MLDETKKELAGILDDVLTDMHKMYTEKQRLTSMYADFLEFLKARIVLPETTTFYPEQCWFCIDINDHERLDIQFRKDSFKCEHFIFVDDPEQDVVEVSDAPSFDYYNSTVKREMFGYIVKFLAINDILTLTPIETSASLNREDVK